MTDDVKPTGPAPGKIVLIVLGVLVGLVVVCCAGAWLLGGDDVWYVGSRLLRFDAELTEKLGNGTVSAPPTKSAEGDWVLLVGVPADFPEERFPEAQDALWNAYCRAFADGGFPVDRVAVGRADTVGGGVGAWAGNTVSVADVSARTGTTAPAVLDRLRATKGSNIRVKINGKSGESGEPGDTPPAEGTK